MLNGSGVIGMNRVRQQGISIVELMVGSLVGMLMFAGAIHVYVSTIGSSEITLKAAKLNQEMRAILHMVANDVRRAGYWSGSVAGVGATNPFTDTTLGHNLVVSGLGGEDADSCVTFTYNLNVTDGGDNPALIGACTSANCVASLPAPFNNTAVYASKTNIEMFGYRKNGDLLEVLTGLGTSDADAVFECADGDWGVLNDGEMVIMDDLGFTLNSQCTNVTESTRNDCNVVLTPGDTSDDATPTVAADDPDTGDYLLFERDVQLTMTAHLAADVNFNHTLDQSVRIRNDRIMEAP